MISKNLATAFNPIIILSVISKKEMYAYDIIKQLKKNSNDQIVIQEGTLYPLLKKYKGQGLITSRWKTVPLGHKRKYYSITQKGKNELYKLRADWTAFSEVLTQYLN